MQTEEQLPKTTSGSLYGRLWRWHFFAAFIVIPFILWQSLTGIAYLWHRELASAAHPELLYVEAGTQGVTYQAQLDSALARHAGQSLTQIQVPQDANRATVFLFTAANGLPYPAFVNPYTGAYLGSVEPAWWLPGTSRALHGGWPLGNGGSYLLELGACWAIVMILTGLYLWWPRRARDFGGVLYPRLSQGRRLFWRDLHSVFAMYFSLIVLAFLLSALPWTSFWGGRVLAPRQAAFGQTSPADSFFAHGATHAAAAPSAADGHAHTLLDLDAVIALARREGLSGGLDINWHEHSAALRSVAERAPERIYLRVDRNSGAIAERAGWEAFPLLPRLVALGVDLHEGRYFGRANQVFNTLLASALLWLSYSGCMSWYRRRPQGKLAPPPRHSVEFPTLLRGSIVFLSLVLPLLGLSIVVLLLCERLFGKLLDPLQA